MTDSPQFVGSFLAEKEDYEVFFIFGKQARFTCVFSHSSESVFPQRQLSWFSKKLQVRGRHEFFFISTKMTALVVCCHLGCVENLGAFSLPCRCWMDSNGIHNHIVQDRRWGYGCFDSLICLDQLSGSLWRRWLVKAETKRQSAHKADIGTAHGYLLPVLMVWLPLSRVSHCWPRWSFLTRFVGKNLRYLSYFTNTFLRHWEPSRSCPNGQWHAWHAWQSVFRIFVDFTISCMPAVSNHGELCPSVSKWVSMASRVVPLTSAITRSSRAVNQTWFPPNVNGQSS